jgi:hypothetical protein
MGLVKLQVGEQIGRIRCKGLYCSRHEQHRDQTLQPWRGECALPDGGWERSIPADLAVAAVALRTLKHW